MPVLAESYRLVRDLLSFRRERAAPTPYGFELAGNAKMVAGDFEPVETKLISDHLEHADVFVDVGANVGYYSCLARRKGLGVVAIEPGTSVLRFLMANLHANDMTDVEVLPVALADKVAISVLYGGGGSASLISGWSRSSSVYSSLIPTTTLDNVLEGRFVDRRLFIKIDIEGAELGCLRGAPKTLARRLAPVWFVEIYLDEGHPEGLNANFLATFELFWSHGYCAYPAVSNSRIVERPTIEQAIKAKLSPFATSNFIFAKPLV